ncbi:hypothetical protein V2J09_011486 [Rumex salicifolius]
MDMSSEFDRIMFFEHARKAAEASYAKDPLDVDNLTRWGSALLELSSFQQPAEAKKMIQDAISKLEEALEVDSKKPETLWCLGNALTSLAFLFSDADEAGDFFTRASDYFTKACEQDPSNELFRKSLEIAAKITGKGVNNCLDMGNNRKEDIWRWSGLFVICCPKKNAYYLAKQRIEMLEKLQSLHLSPFTIKCPAPELHAEFHKGGFAQQMQQAEANQTIAGPSASSSSRTTTKKKKNSDLTYDILGWVILAVGIVTWVGFAAKNNMPPPPQPR